MSETYDFLERRSRQRSARQRHLLRNRHQERIELTKPIIAESGCGASARFGLGSLRCYPLVVAFKENVLRSPRYSPPIRRRFSRKAIVLVLGLAPNLPLSSNIAAADSTVAVPHRTPTNITAGAAITAPSPTLIGASVSLLDYGIRCDGATDTTRTIETAAATLSARGGGYLLLPPTVCAVGSSGDLDLSSYPGVTITGSIGSTGWVANNARAPYTLLLNAGHTIKLGPQSGLFGIRIARQGIGAPKNIREALEEIANFAGTALTLSNVKDVNIAYVTINGFSTAISHTNSDRIHYDHVMGDDTNFLALNGCGDTCTANQMEAWDFLTGPYNISPQQEAPPIRAFRKSGGVIEVALSKVPPFPFQTGDTIIIGNTTYAYQAPNGRYTISRIDNTHFTLDGSSYSQPYSVAHEIAFLSVGLRKGTAFSFQNTGMVLMALVDYGHDVSLQYGAHSEGMQCLGCWFDGDSDGGTNADPVPIGLVNGAPPGSSPVAAQQNKFVGGSIYDKAISIYNNSSMSRPLLVANVSPLAIVGCAANTLGAGVAVVSGSVIVSNSDFEANSSCSGGYPFAVYDAATLLRLDGVRVEGKGGTYYKTERTDCPKFVNDNEIRCAARKR